MLCLIQYVLLVHFSLDSKLIFMIANRVILEISYADLVLVNSLSISLVKTSSTSSASLILNLLGIKKIAMSFSTIKLSKNTDNSNYYYVHPPLSLYAVPLWPLVL